MGRGEAKGSIKSIMVHTRGLNWERVCFLRAECGRKISLLTINCLCSKSTSSSLFYV